MTDKKVFEVEDKYKKEKAREAFKKDNEGKYLNSESLEDDIISEDAGGDEGPIVDSKHPENQEWNAREHQNRT